MVTAAAAVALLSLAGGANAATGAAEPRLDRLWERFPLDPEPSVSAPAPGPARGFSREDATAPRSQPVARRAVALPSRPSGTDAGGRSAPVAAALVATVVLIVLAASALIRVGAPAGALSRRDVLDDLMRATAPSAWRRRERRRRAPAAAPEASSDAWKRDRGAGDDAEALKTKLRKAEGADPEQLKRKLVVERPAAEPPKPVRLVDSTPEARAAPAPAVECEIVWWRGYVKSQFQAIASAGGDGGAVLASSRLFRWRRSEPPPESPEAVRAFRELVDGLEADGWSVRGRGDDWFALRLRRDPAPVVRGVEIRG